MLLLSNILFLSCSLQSSLPSQSRVSIDVQGKRRHLLAVLASILSKHASRLNSSDVCDADVDFTKHDYTITGGELSKIQGNNKDVDMPTSAIEVTAAAIDDTGNK